jgi:hypothetical protein
LGREWVSPQGETKYFNSVQGWRIEKAGAEPQAPHTMPTANFAPTNLNEDEPDDCLLIKSTVKKALISSRLFF